MGQSAGATHVAAWTFMDRVHGGGATLDSVVALRDSARGLLRRTDHLAMRINAITAGHVSAAMLPLDYETDREVTYIFQTQKMTEPVIKKRIVLPLTKKQKG